jgi:hypothetical protein
MASARIANLPKQLSAAAYHTAGRGRTAKIADDAQARFCDDRSAMSCRKPACGLSGIFAKQVRIVDKRDALSAMTLRAGGFRYDPRCHAGNPLADYPAS